MYTFTLFIRALAALLALISTTVFAQNLVENGEFDGSIDGWTQSGSVEWTSFGMDYGSIHLASETTASSASQCIPVESGSALVATAEVTGQCPGARLYAIWSDRSDCSDIGSFPGNGVVAQLHNEWELLTVFVPARDDAYMIDVELLNLGGCSGGFTFDDVTLRYDEIYNDDFEIGHGIGAHPH